MHDGDGVGDDPQQPVLLPLGRLLLFAVLVKVVQQQQEPRHPQRCQLTDRAEDRSGEAEQEAEDVAAAVVGGGNGGQHQAPGLQGGGAAGSTGDVGVGMDM